MTLAPGFDPQVIAIIADGELDQIIPIDGSNPEALNRMVKREVQDLRAMGCTVRTRKFETEEAAYTWADKYL